MNKQVNHEWMHVTDRYGFGLVGIRFVIGDLCRRMRWAIGNRRSQPKRFFRQWLSSRQMGLLWGLVLLRMLVPVAPSSTFSLQNLLPSSERGMSEISRPSLEASPNPHAASYAAPPIEPYGAEDSQVSFIPRAATHAIDLWSAFELFVTMLPLVWLTGATICFIGTMITYWQFCRRLKHVPVCEDPRLRSLWDECCIQAGVRRNIPIVLFEGVQQPAVLGLLSPTLLLPVDSAELSDQHLRMIMFHELAHVRHWDLAANWLLVVIRAIHWWNPIYWLAAARFQCLREQACDAFAVRQIEGQPVRDYSELLLTLAQRQQSGLRWRVILPASILSFFSSLFRKRAVRNRLQALRSASVTRSYWHTAAVVGLVALVAICGLTDARSPETTTDPSPDWLSGFDWDWKIEPQIESGPIVTRTYDVEKAIDRIALDEQTKDDARMQLKWMIVHLLRSSSGQSHDLKDESPEEMFTLDGTILTVNAPPNLHQEILRNLGAWEQSGLAQICIETRFVTDDRDIASRIGITWRYLEAFSAERPEDLPFQTNLGMPVVRANTVVDDYLPIVVATLNDRQAFDFIQAAQGERRANVLQAPKVTLFNGQKATVEDSGQRPFVVGIQTNAEGLKRPKVAVVSEGIKLTLRAIQSSDAQQVQLEASVDMSKLDDVRTASTLLLGQPTTIQIPRVERRHIEISSEVQDGQSLLVGCLPTDDQKQFFFLLLTVRNVFQPTDETD